ncbi:unnamed protein product [Amoebophrya sp. A120]|nr:unnamed protein product [Amoebophrya sp. A120]|eukprot:GSA120T00003826001.1
MFGVTWVAFGSVAVCYALLLLYVKEPKKKKHADEYHELLSVEEEKDAVLTPAGLLATEDASKSTALAVKAGSPETDESKDATKGSSEIPAAPAAKIEPKNKMSDLQRKILWITIVGCSFDSAGDEGTRIARGTVLQNVWPATNDIMFQNVLLLSLIVIICLSMAITGIGRAKVGLGATAALGAAATLGTQLCLNKAIIHHKNYTTFLAVWYFGKLFGICSSLAAFFIVNDYSPKDQIGTWSGRLQLAMGVMEAISTMTIANVYDAANEPDADGKLSEDGKYGVVAMFVTAGVSTMAVFAYAPLIRMVPAPFRADAEREKKFTCKSVEEYLALSDGDWGKLTYEEIDYYEAKRYAKVLEQAEKDKLDVQEALAGIVPRQPKWGAYPANGAADDGGEIAAFLSNASANLQFVKTRLTGSLTDHAKMEEERKMIVAYQKNVDEKVNREEQAIQMGKWLAGYFDDAGYTDWSTTPQFFKAMMVGAFPPITPLDGSRVDYQTVDMEKLYVGYMKSSDRLLGNTIAVQKDKGSALGGATKDKTQLMGVTRTLSHGKLK